MDDTDSTRPERFDLEPEPDDAYTRGKRAGRRLGGYTALMIARRVLWEAGPAELARILRPLVVVDDLAGVLRALEDAADRAGEGGEPR